MEPFEALFGSAPAVTATAPGRVNLIGEHTDYNGGLVLPIAIAQRTTVDLSPRPGRRVRVASRELGGTAEYEVGAERAGHDWADYVRGCTWALVAGGHAVGGFDARIASQVPVGSGLSSSAALEVAVLRALRAAFGLQLDDVELARIAHHAESGFAGARVGIMDQMAASLADTRTALFLDTRTLAVARVPIPAGAAVAVIDSGVAHSHAAGDYNTRRAECERAASLLGVRELRDVTLADLPRAAQLPEPLGRRVRHVVTENERVVAAVAAMRAGDLERLGALFRASHASMRDDYEVSIPAIDLLVDLACAQPGVLGARLTGGGFGGSIVMLARAAEVDAAARGTVHAYEARTGRRATVLERAS